ncbi:MAG: ribosome assembly RNA-binding protein YhbY [Legionella sp.]|nr:ribosome assembly RNA-binding protein YhbY [Legionella sp.]
MNIAQKKRLKAEAHHLKPVIIVGAQGVTDALIKETNYALEAHELIKVKVNGEDKADRNNIAMRLCEALKAEFLQLIGSTAIIYRRKQEK